MGHLARRRARRARRGRRRRRRRGARGAPGPRRLAARAERRRDDEEEHLPALRRGQQHVDAARVLDDDVDALARERARLKRRVAHHRRAAVFGRAGARARRLASARAPRRASRPCASRTPPWRARICVWGLLCGRSGASEGGFQRLSARGPWAGTAAARRPAAAAAVHLEVSESVALTGDAHLLHGGSASALRSLPSFLPTKKSSSSPRPPPRCGSCPSVSVADKSTIRVAGGLSVDGGPRRLGLSVRGGGSVRGSPRPPRRRVVRVQRGDRPRGLGRLGPVDGAGALTVTGRGEDAGCSPSGTRTRRIRRIGSRAGDVLLDRRGETRVLGLDRRGARPPRGRRARDELRH